MWLLPCGARAGGQRGHTAPTVLQLVSLAWPFDCAPRPLFPRAQMMMPATIASAQLPPYTPVAQASTSELLVGWRLMRGAARH